MMVQALHVPQMPMMLIVTHLKMVYVLTESVLTDGMKSLVLVLHVLKVVLIAKLDLLMVLLHVLVVHVKLLVTFKMETMFVKIVEQDVILVLVLLNVVIVLKDIVQMLILVLLHVGNVQLDVLHVQPVEIPLLILNNVLLVYHLATPVQILIVAKLVLQDIHLMLILIHVKEMKFS